MRGWNRAMRLLTGFVVLVVGFWFVWQYLPASWRMFWLGTASVTRKHVARSKKSCGIRHLAMVMDGNRRWAKKHGLAAIAGHEKGVEPIKHVSEYCVEHGIKYLSLFAFSLENFKRSETEKKALFTLIPRMASKWCDEMVKNKVRVRFLGDRSKFPAQTMEAIEKLEEVTKEFDTLTISFLFCYGGQQDIVSATKRLAQKVKNGTLSVDDIDEKMFGRELWTGDLPEPDLIIRTGKRSRISNFFLYQAAYSEIAFLDCYWPDVTSGVLDRCITKFVASQKNFGV